MILPLYVVFVSLLFCIRITAFSNGIQELYRFSNETGIANILVLRNESLLLSLFTEPSLYRLDPKSSKPVLVQRFPGRTSLFGIEQINQYQLAVIAGKQINKNYDINLAVPGSFSVFLLSLRGRILRSFSVLEASSLRSITTLPKSPQYLLLSDPVLAVVWRLNIRTGDVDKVINSIDLSIFGHTPVMNSVHVQGDLLYYTDIISQSVARLRITSDGRSSGNAPEIRITDPRGTDPFEDFAIRQDGSIYFSLPTGVAYILPFETPFERDFDVVSYGILLGEDFNKYPTAVAFSNNAPRCNILYIVTAGLVFPILDFPELVTPEGESAKFRLEGGQVLKVNLDLAYTSTLYPATYNTSCKAKPGH